MTWLVMWDHFPRDFFKYIAILAAILILGAFLGWAIPLRVAAAEGHADSAPP